MLEKDREQEKDKVDLWYGTHRYRTKDLKEYVVFLTNLLREIIYNLAFICRDIRVLEGRQ